MGAKFGKRKTITISEKTNGHQKEKKSITPTNHTDGTTTVEKLKKKEKISKQSSVDSKVDKCTNTDSGVISSTASIKRVIGGSACDNISFDNGNGRVNSVDRCETPSKDVIELRNACIRRGIISAETNPITLRKSYLFDSQDIPETASSVFLDNEQIQTEQQIDT
jgi:hypothetical protein